MRVHSVSTPSEYFITPLQLSCPPRVGQRIMKNCDDTQGSAYEMAPAAVFLCDPCGVPQSDQTLSKTTRGARHGKKSATTP